MKLLAIDTSTERASLALLYNGQVSCMEQSAQKKHAQLLLPMIETLLADAGIGLAQLDGVAFGRGPGSFTGLRIACSVAKGLAYAHDIPLYPISTLAAIADESKNRHPDKTENAVLAMIDARMNQVYWACYFSNGDTGEQVSSVVDILINGNFPLTLAGAGIDSYREHIPEAINSRISNQVEIYPSGAAMLRIAASGNIAAVSAAEALPIYVRNQVVQK
jgi:tRNA threonylcarbamoyladenosine biosynthesis protein TsaB